MQETILQIKTRHVRRRPELRKKTVHRAAVNLRIREHPVQSKLGIGPVAEHTTFARLHDQL